MILISTRGRGFFVTFTLHLCDQVMVFGLRQLFSADFPLHSRNSSLVMPFRYGLCRGSLDILGCLKTKPFPICDFELIKVKRSRVW